MAQWATTEDVKEAIGVEVADLALTRANAMVEAKAFRSVPLPITDDLEAAVSDDDRERLRLAVSHQAAFLKENPQAASFSNLQSVRSGDVSMSFGRGGDGGGDAAAFSSVVDDLIESLSWNRHTGGAAKFPKTPDPAGMWAEESSIIEETL